MSARQKMINMMYLVLTAMLALNVSSELLLAFETMRGSLNMSEQTSAESNSDLAASILASVNNEESGGNMKHSFLKGLVNEASSESSKMIAYLNELTEDLEGIGAKDEETGEIVRNDENIENYRYWLGSDDEANGGRGNGKALELREKLNLYIDWANKMVEQHLEKGETPVVFGKIAVEPSEDPSIIDPEAKAKTWEYLTFHEKPVIADLAMVAKYKTDIRSVETRLLNFLKGKLDDQIISVDSIFAFEAPSSQVVTAGMKYETRILVGMASNSVQPEFIGSGITTDPTGSTATMSMTANGSVIPNGATEGIQRYRATIKIPTRDGGVQELPLEGQFTVRKPEIQVRSKELQLLYKSCGNTVIVDAPSLGELYNPDFSRSSGGRVLPNSNNRKEITIVPSNRQFKLSVYTKTNGQNIKLDELNYKVIRPPKPRVAVFTGSGEHNGMAPVSKRSSVKVRVLPDVEFKASLPRDARYKADKVRLLFSSGIGAPREITSKSGANIMNGVTINLNQGAVKNAVPGDKVYIQVEGIRRVNFQNKNIEESIPLADRTFALVLR